MKNKIITALAICCICANMFAKTVDEHLETLTTNMASWAQENTMALNTTADSYVGKMVPSIPPHFHVGISAATTIIDTKPIADATDAVGMGFPKMSRAFILPTYSINLRIGGFFLPFDIGFFGTFTIPPSGINLKFKEADINANMTNLGVDIRYAIVEGKNLWPKISLGIGYFYNNQKYGFGVSNDDINTSINMSLNMHTIYAQLQVSKQFLFLLPYIGVRAAFSSVDNKYKYAIAEIEHEGSVKENFSISEVQPQIYAGLGFMIPFSQITLNAAFNPRRNLWTFALHAGFRL